MKRFVYIAVVMILLLAGCVPAIEQPETAYTITDTVKSPPTSTKPSLPTATKRPSATPTTPTITPIPPATLTPMAIISLPANPKALSEVNSGTEMVRINLFDVGEVQDVNFSRAGIIDLDGVTRYVVSVIYPDGQIKLFDLHTGNVVRVLQLDCCAFTGLAFAPDQRTVAT